MRWLGILVLTVLLMGFPASGELIIANMIRVVVNDAIITDNEVRMNALAGLESLRRMHAAQPLVYEQEERKILEENLEMLVERQLILNEYKTSGLMFPEAVIEDEIKRRIREKYVDRANLTKELQAQGMTYEEYRRRLREDFIVLAMRQRNITTALIMSPAKIQRYYQEHLTNYALGDQVKLRVIELPVTELEDSTSVRQRMQEVLRKIEGGASFTEMAAVYSESGKPAGDWDWWERSRLLKGLADIAFALQPGQRSGIVGKASGEQDAYTVYLYNPDGQVQLIRQYGWNSDGSKMVLLEEAPANPQRLQDLADPGVYYLMRVEDQREARTKALAEVQDEIEKELLQKEYARLRTKWIKRLKEKSFVRYF